MYWLGWLAGPAGLAGLAGLAVWADWARWAGWTGGGVYLYKVLMPLAKCSHSLDALGGSADSVFAGWDGWAGWMVIFASQTITCVGFGGFGTLLAFGGVKVTITK